MTWKNLAEALVLMAMYFLGIAVGLTFDKWYHHIISLIGLIIILSLNYKVREMK